MSLDELTDDVTAAHADLGEQITLDLDRETRNELSMLAAAFEPNDPAELLARGVHLLFRTAVDTGTLDFHLRGGYDVTYDEYLSGMTYEEMTGVDQFPQRADDDRRYQF